MRSVNKARDAIDCSVLDLLLLLFDGSAFTKPLPWLLPSVQVFQVPEVFVCLMVGGGGFFVSRLGGFFGWVGAAEEAATQIISQRVRHQLFFGVESPCQWRHR